MDFIFPRSRITVLREFNKQMDQENIPKPEKNVILTGKK
jgi:hypothetical protein